MPELAKVLENSYSKLLVIWWYWDFVCRGAFRLLDLLQIRPLLWCFGWQPCFLILVERGRKNNRKNTLLHTDNFSVERQLSIHSKVRLGFHFKGFDMYLVMHYSVGLNTKHYTCISYFCWLLFDSLLASAACFLASNSSLFRTLKQRQLCRKQ